MIMQDDEGVMLCRAISSGKMVDSALLTVQRGQMIGGIVCRSARWAEYM